MAINTTPKGFAKFLDNLAEIAEKEAPRIEQTALLSGLGEYKRRIFNSGEDSNNAPIGKKARSKPKDKFVGDYTKNYYERVRSKRGAGDKKNLNIDGSHVRNKIQPGRSGDQNTFGFIDDASAVIAVGQEDIHDKPIFDPSNKEVDLIIDQYVEEVFDLIEKSLKSIAV